MNRDLIISDANILIDLANLNILDAFTQLNFNCHTTDYVLAELNNEQQTLIKQLELDGKMQVISSDSQDIMGILQLVGKSSGLSVQDCSVWHFSKKINAVMQTGDRKLRKEAESDKITVRGILFIFDELLRQELIDFQKAIHTITLLQQTNNRLPADEINKRIDEWGKGNLV